MKIAIGLALLFALGCATANTPDEFRQAVKSGGSFTRFEKLRVPRGFDSVYKSVEVGAKTCLNKAITTGGNVSMGKYAPNVYEQNTVRYSTQMTKAKASGSLIVRKDMPGAVNQPKGGFYFAIADLKDLGQNQTEVLIYGSTIGKIPDGIMAWAKGNESQCPKLD